MIKRLLHKFIVGWCLYGLIRVLIFIHPWMFWLAERVKPYFSKGDWEYGRDSAGHLEKIYTHVAWDSGSIVQNFWVWGAGIVVIGVVLIILWLLSELSNWLFNKRGDQDTTLKRMDVGQDNLIADVKAIKEMLKSKDAEEDEE